MRIAAARKVCLGVFMLIAMARVATAQQSQPVQPVDNQALRNAGQNPNDWLMSPRDYAGTRYSPLKQIDASNASRLGLAWYYDTDSFPGTLESTPLVWNGTLYVTTTWSVVHAIDARTGQERWRWDPSISHHNFPVGSAGNPNKVRTGPSVCCGPGNRGVAIYDGKIYVGTLDNVLAALDAETGKLVWQVRTSEQSADYSITGAPLIVKGKVIVGNGGAEYAVRGYVTAYDAETGKQLWRFYTVPGDPSKPFENKAMKDAAKTWKGEWYKLGGGGTPWDGFAYDPKLDLLYLGTANGGPWVSKFRSQEGDNLYLCSIIALKPETGKFVWYFQTVPNDEWDYDATQDITLTDLTINGKTEHVLLQAPKDGFFYVLDRKNGRFISGQNFVKVTWATGLDPKTGRPIEAKDVRYDEAPKTVWPGPAGGHTWNAMSFSPDTGLAYIPALDSSFLYVAAKEFKPELGEYNWGIVFAFPGQPNANANGTPPPPPQPPARPVGFLSAWDPVTQTERWRALGMNGGGTVTTAGNLVFAGSGTGEFAAFTADKGEKIWSVKLPAGFANPITYMVDGKQYVAVLSGRAGKGRVYSFALDANRPIPPTPNLPPPPGLPAGE